MKKALTFVVVVAMLLSLCVVNAFAVGENTGVVERVAAAECAQVAVKLSLNTAGVVSAAGQMNFDKNSVELVDVIVGSAFQTVIGPESVAAANEMGAVPFTADSATATEDLTGSVEVLTAVFAVKEGVESADFSVTVESACNKDLADVVFEEGDAVTIDTTVQHNFAGATCEAPKTCTVCGATEGEALGHTAGDAATCTNAQVCTVCGAELAPATGHHFEAGKCTVCGADDPDFKNPSIPDEPKPDQPDQPNQPGNDNPGEIPDQKKDETVTGSVDLGTEPVTDQAVLDDVKVTIPENVFPEETKLVVEKIVSGERYDTVQEVFDKVFDKTAERVSKFVPYDISAIKNNVKVQPNGAVTVTFDIPESFDPARTAVYYVSDDGKVEKIESTVDAASRKITATLTHFSTYVVAETKTVKKDSPNTSSADGLAVAGLISVLAAVAVVAKKKF